MAKAKLKSLKSKTSDPSLSRPKEFTVKNIQEILGRDSNKVMFSFEFFDRSEHCFSLGGVAKVCDNWFVSLLAVLKDLSGRTWV